MDIKKILDKSIEHGTLMPFPENKARKEITISVNEDVYDYFTDMKHEWGKVLAHAVLYDYMMKVEKSKEGDDE